MRIYELIIVYEPTGIHLEKYKSYFMSRHSLSLLEVWSNRVWYGTIGTISNRRPLCAAEESIFQLQLLKRKTNLEKFTNNKNKNDERMFANKKKMLCKRSRNFRREQPKSKQNKEINRAR